MEEAAVEASPRKDELGGFIRPVLSPEGQGPAYIKLVNIKKDIFKSP
jgi:hypothetical protein